MEKISLNSVGGFCSANIIIKITSIGLSIDIRLAKKKAYPSIHGLRIYNLRQQDNIVDCLLPMWTTKSIGYDYYAETLEEFRKMIKLYLMEQTKLQPVGRRTGLCLFDPSIQQSKMLL
ncbi:unnamed protein product, partial [Dovyalis caffra]